MCELMGMCFAKPIAADFTLREFASRDAGNPDGWGLAWYPDRSAAVVKEPINWRGSDHTRFLESYHGLQSCIYIAHVREKSVGGGNTHADTHPFLRELEGREYTFAHNGTLQGFAKLPLGRFRPVGNTDSEHFFCHLLEEVAGYPGCLERPESWPRLHRKLVESNELGKLNVMFSDGRRLFCYHDRGKWKGMSFRKVILRDGSVRHLGDDTLMVDLEGAPANSGVVIASAALSPTRWVPFHPGELLVLEDGAIRYASHHDEALPTKTAALQHQ